MLLMTVKSVSSRMFLMIAECLDNMNDPNGLSAENKLFWVWLLRLPPFPAQHCCGNFWNIAGKKRHVFF